MDRPDFLQLAAEIEALQSAWAKRHAPRERGARTALAGYTYQFLVVLLRTVERWLESPPDARADRQVFHEFLSDAIELTDAGLICVTQIKLRQSSSLLRRALEELWNIYEVATEEQPHLLDRLSFRVLAAESDLSDVGAAVSRWCEERVEKSGSIVEQFRGRLTIGRETHPEDRLFALLANAKDLHAPSPQTYIDRWLGQIAAATGAAVDSKALRQAEHRILDDLVTLYNRRYEGHPGVYIWTEEDRPPTTVLPGRFLAGRQPRIGDLRDGCFACLPALYNDLHNSARVWIEQVATGSRDRYKLPLLWLQGRSGSGKSVALLHLLARLHEDGRGPIFWLGQRPSLLPTAMQLAIQASRQGKISLISLDDPYTPGVQESARRDWEKAFAELQAYQDAADEFSGPVLVVCCGPTEQASQFMADFPDDVEMRRVQVPLKQEHEIAELRRWYEERTGQKPPQVGDEHVLLVQLFFEWQHGEPLLEFAARFRKRVEGVDRSNALFDRLSKVFALNRLYVGYPPAAVPHGLSLVQEGLLRQLESDEHFGIDASGERNGLWWLHPHLANGIYEAWYLPEPRNMPARREHLRVGIEDSLLHGQRPGERTAPLWAIARALRPNAEADLSQRLQAIGIRELLTGCYHQIAASHGNRLPLELVPVWIELSALASNLSLNPDPIQEGIRQVNAEHLRESGLRLTCHKLLQHLTEMPGMQAEKALDAIFSLLQAAPGWHEWLPIAWDAVQRVRDTRLWALVAGWVMSHATNSSAPRLLELCLRLTPKDRHLVATAERLLPAAQPEVAWGDVALRLLDATPGSSAPASVLAWAQENRRERGICFVLGALLRRQIVPALQWAREWLPIWHREASANFVLEPMLAIEGRNDQIIDWSLAWLDVGRGDPSFLMQRLLELSSNDLRILSRIERWLTETDPSNRSWGFVWRELWNAQPQNPELLAAGRAWLADPSHEGWSHVWQEIRNVRPDDAEILTEGRTWLTRADPNHGGWGYVWQEIRKAQSDNAEILAEGRVWLLKADPDHGSWGHVWQELWKAQPDDTEILTAGRAWLTKADPNHGGWGHVWQEIRRALPDDAEILAAGRIWLIKADPNHGGWGHVWQELWKAQPNDTEILTAGRAWLTKADPNHGGWGHVWPEIRRALPDDAEILAAGRIWLTKADPNHGGWRHVWQELWKAQPDDTEILTAGRAWLTKADPNHGGWGHVWPEIRRALPDDAEILAAGRVWLTRADPNHAGWSYVWQEIWKAQPDDTEILTAGRAWLTRADPNHAGWSYVWQEIRKAQLDDTEILTAGRAWLAKADPNHGGWGHVWQEIWKAQPDNAEVLAEGRAWLTKADLDHTGWGYVWPEIRKAQPDNSEILTAGRDWLAKADPNHRGWGHVWRGVRKAQPDDAELVIAAQTWLAKVDPNHGSWRYVWQKLRKVQPEDANLLAVGRAWLTKADPSHGEWGQVWHEIRQAQPHDAELLAAGCQWLKRIQGEHADWLRVWREIWKDNHGDPTLVSLACSWLGDQDPHGQWFQVFSDITYLLDKDLDLVQKARRWLDQKELRQRSWPYMWRGLLQFFADNTEFLDMGKDWLVQAKLADRTWAYVWQALWNLCPGDSMLTQISKPWLEQQLVDIAWPFVWMKLHCHFPGQEDLRRLAMRWLGKSKPSHKQWVVVWSTLRESDPGFPDLIEHGRRWLEQVPPTQPGRDEIEAGVRAMQASRREPSAYGDFKNGAALPGD